MSLVFPRGAAPGGHDIQRPFLSARVLFALPPFGAARRPCGGVANAENATRPKAAVGETQKYAKEGGAEEGGKERRWIR